MTETQKETVSEKKEAQKTEQIEKQASGTATSSPNELRHFLLFNVFRGVFLEI